jgi:hypothetical protein
MLITIDPEAHKLVNSWVHAASPSEIGGIGYVELVDKGLFHISEFVLLEQEASVGSVDFEGEAYVEEIMRAAEDHKENELRLSWHSHGSMDTYWSSIDEKGITEYKSVGMPWLVSLCFNTEGSILGRLDIFDHETCDHIKFEDVDASVDLEPELLERAKEDVKKFVKKPSSNINARYTGYDPNRSVKQHVKNAWDDEDNGSDDDDIMDMPNYIEAGDFIDPTRFAIMEMQYGSKTVEHWEDELFYEGVLTLGEADDLVGFTDDDDDEVRILTP